MARSAAQQRLAPLLPLSPLTLPHPPRHSLSPLLIADRGLAGGEQGVSAREGVLTSARIPVTPVPFSPGPVSYRRSVHYFSSTQQDTYVSPRESHERKEER